MFKKIISISLMFILVFVGTNKTIAAQEPEKETITVYLQKPKNGITF